MRYKLAMRVRSNFLAIFADAGTPVVNIAFINIQQMISYPSLSKFACYVLQVVQLW